MTDLSLKDVVVSNTEETLSGHVSGIPCSLFVFVCVLLSVVPFFSLVSLLFSNIDSVSGPI